MDNQYILKLVEKDLDELNSLVDALKKEEVLSEVLIEIVANKAATLQKEIQMLSAEKANSVERIEIVKSAEVTEKVEEKVAEEKDEISIESENIEEVVEKQEMVEIIAEPQVEIDEDIMVAENEEEKIVEKELPVDSENIDSKPKESEEKKVIGERFSKEASLNDRIAKNAIQSKVKPKPITNLKSAIGINDRFLYQRELFENSAETMNLTIEALEQADSIKEAIAYLESKFTWNEDDTSLKFLDLVKRRFQN